MARPRRRHHASFWKRHSLTLIVAAILALWLTLYRHANPDTHIGAFYGNAIADWTGTLMIVVATKYLRESRSSQSRRPHPRERSAVGRALARHSLTLSLLGSGILWVVLFGRSDPTGKSGAVLGNIVSEWTQLLGLVVITKYAREAGSKEGG